MVKQKTMSSAPIDRERRLPRVTYAVIQSNGLFDQEVLIAADEENLGEALAFEVTSQTPPKRVGSQLSEIRDTLSERRWADARCIKQLGEIAEHVTARLGPDVELTLEVRAKNSDGFDDATRRTVSENATNLGSRSSEFE